MTVFMDIGVVPPTQEGLLASNLGALTSCDVLGSPMQDSPVCSHTGCSPSGTEAVLERTVPLC